MDLNSATSVALALNVNFTIKTNRSCRLSLIGKFGEQGYNHISNSNEPLLLVTVERNAIHIYIMV
jgi:hypothetical protein